MRQITVNGMRVKDSSSFEDVVERLATVFPTEEIEIVNYNPEAVISSGNFLPVFREVMSHVNDPGTEDAKAVYVEHARALFRNRHESFGE